MNQFYGNILPMNQMQPINCYSKAQVELWNKNRLLWEQHVYWTRMAITSIVFKLPDLKFVLARLLRNATDMGDSLRPYYGDKIADAYRDLITRTSHNRGRFGDRCSERGNGEGGAERGGLVSGMQTKSWNF